MSNKLVEQPEGTTPIRVYIPNDALDLARKNDLRIEIRLVPTSESFKALYRTIWDEEPEQEVLEGQRPRTGDWTSAKDTPTLEECRAAADLLRREATAIDGSQPIRRFWISVKDALPDDAVVIVYAKSADFEKPLITAAWHDKGFGWSGLPTVWCDQITHWMPLPEAPE